MALFSSKSNKGFYDSAITPDLPPDAFEIDPETYLALQQAQMSGKVIDFDAEPPIARAFVPSPEQARSTAVATRDALLLEATTRIAPLQDAVDLGNETASEVALLMQWKQFRVDVNRVDITQLDPVWPSRPGS